MTKAQLNKARNHNLEKARAAQKAKWAAMTPAQRSREMKRRMKPKHKEVKRGNRTRTHKGSTNQTPRPLGGGFLEHVSYLCGKIETLVEYYARGNALSEPALTEGVAAFLQGKARR